MAVYTITNQQRTDDFVVVKLLTEPDLNVGDVVTIAGLNHGMDGTHTVYALPPYLFIGVDGQGDLMYNPAVPIANQVLYYDAGSEVERSAAPAGATLTYNPVCTWITGGDIEDWLGIGTASQLDQDFLDQCAAAANQFCYRRRQEAGYYDSLTTVPNDAAKLGTIQYGGALYRSRGSIGDAFAAFDQMGAASYTGLSAIVKQLLGIDRPALA